MWKRHDPEFRQAYKIGVVAGALSAAVTYLILMWVLGKAHEWLALAGAFLVYVLAWDLVLNWALKKAGSSRQSLRRWL